MRLLTKDTHNKDSNLNTSLISNIEYAAGSDNLFTQPPPPTIARDVESLADDVEPHKGDGGDLVHKSDSDQYNDEDDDIVGQMMEDTYHEHVNDNVNDASKFTTESTTCEVDICRNDNDDTDKSTHKDTDDKTDNLIHEDDDKTDNLIHDEDKKSDNSLCEDENYKTGNLICEDDNKTDNLIHKDDVHSKDTDHGNNGNSSNTDNNSTIDHVDDGNEGTEETSKKEIIVNKMDEIILTEESFLQFIDKDFENDVESNIESFIDDSNKNSIWGRYYWK